VMNMAPTKLSTVKREIMRSPKNHKNQNDILVMARILRWQNAPQQSGPAACHVIAR
jgi:hypothetical protein